MTKIRLLWPAAAAALALSCSHAPEFRYAAYPSPETSRELYDELDYIRGVEVWLRHLPTASLASMLEGLRRDLGLDRANRIALWEDRMDAQSQVLTGNTELVYLFTYVDTLRDGPTVIEAPPGILGALDDHYFRHVIDIGVTGLDKGRGGKYLVVPPDYVGDVPSGYFVARPKTYRSWWFGSGQLQDGRPDAAVGRFKARTKVYPLSRAISPLPMEFVNASGVAANTIPPDDYRLFEQVAEVVRGEHPDALSSEERGLLAAIGIRSGRPFEPSDQLRATLERSAATANGIARAITWDTRDERVWVYPDRKWKTGFLGGSYEFVDADGSRDLDARILFHYSAIGITPAMALKTVGRGSQHLWTNVDADGRYLDGAKTYRLRYPPAIPVGAFWSVIVYDPETRSMLATDQKYPGISTLTDPALNGDGSLDLYFAPTRPAGVPESNWLQTDAKKGWHTILRFYGPSEAFFEGGWKPGDLVEVPAGQL